MEIFRDANAVDKFAVVVNVRRKRRQPLQRQNEQTERQGAVRIHNFYFSVTA